MDYYFQILSNIGCYLLFVAVLLQLTTYLTSCSKKRKEN